MEVCPEAAVMQNFKGETPFHIAITYCFFEILDALKPKISEAIIKKDQSGENPLFLAIRSGDNQYFNYFKDDPNYTSARSIRNSHGQSIEHLVCELCSHAIVKDVDPRPDTKDYVGNMPLFHSIAHNDVHMI